MATSIALEAVRKAIAKEKPDLVAVAGDLVLNGPDPSGAVDILREMEADGAAIVSGNTDIAVADFDYAAAFPWMSDGVPDIFRAAAEWAHDELGDERISWLRRLPAERRLRADDGTMILVCHASPGSQTAGLRQGARSERRDRARQPDRRARHRLRPHPRPRGPRPRLEARRQRRLGRLRLRRRPDRIVGAHRHRRRDAGTAEIKRTEFDVLAVANAISARGLPGDVYRAATVRTGKLVR